MTTPKKKMHNVGFLVTEVAFPAIVFCICLPKQSVVWVAECSGNSSKQMGRVQELHYVWRTLDVTTSPFSSSIHRLQHIVNNESVALSLPCDCCPWYIPDNLSSYYPSRDFLIAFLYVFGSSALSCFIFPFLFLCALQRFSSPKHAAFLDVAGVHDLNLTNWKLIKCTRAPCRWIAGTLLMICCEEKSPSCFIQFFYFNLKWPRFVGFWEQCSFLCIYRGPKLNFMVKVWLLDFCGPPLTVHCGGRWCWIIWTTCLIQQG